MIKYRVSFSEIIEVNEKKAEDESMEPWEVAGERFIQMIKDDRFTPADFECKPVKNKPKTQPAEDALEGGEG